MKKQSLIERVSKYYGVNQKVSQKACMDAFELFLCVEEIEEFIIPYIEYEINKKYVTTK